ncbi:MAG: hypothetical protein ACK5QS_05380 [Pseudanabaenaceae cyanobacterium]
MLKIGLLSGHFRRHAIGWCCSDWVCALTKVAEVRFYFTAPVTADDMTQKFRDTGSPFYTVTNHELSAKLSELSQVIQRDRLDVLVEFDSIMAPDVAPLIYSKPAPIVVSWPGFCAPYLQQDQYFVADHHMLPPEVDSHFRERLLRMPDSYLAVSGLDGLPIDREAVRHDLGLSPEQVVYLSVTPGHKFNYPSARAIVEILSRVPDSVLLCKSRGNGDLMRQIYDQVCAEFTVDSRRIQFLMPRTKTEEEHRTVYQIADVLLDSYPYNSCTHCLEGLWVDLPVVTKVGEQMFSRFVYSFLQTLGIKEGIAYTWGEYVDWGVNLGLDHTLRANLKQKLYQSRQQETLAPLWNPDKFAADFVGLISGI